MPSKKSMVHLLVPHGLDNYDQNRNPAVDYLHLSYSEFELLCSLSSQFGFCCYVDDESFCDGRHLDLKKALMRALGQDVPKKAEPMPTKPERPYVGPAQFQVQPRATVAAAPLPKNQRKLVQDTIDFITEKCRLGFMIVQGLP
jgi:hypothetical protein